MPSCIVLYGNDTCVGFASYYDFFAVNLESEEMLYSDEFKGSLSSFCLTALGDGKRLALASDEAITILNLENREMVS